MYPRNPADAPGVSVTHAVLETIRNVAALSKWHSFGKAGHDLVQAEEDPRERRRKIITLTDKGRELAAQLSDLIQPHNRPTLRRTA